jgi:hypothetical protein
MRHRYRLFLRAKIEGQIETTFLMVDFGPQFQGEIRSEGLVYDATRSFRNYTTAKFSYYIEAENLPNLTGKIQKDRRVCPLSIKRQKKRKMSAGIFTFLCFPRTMLRLHTSSLAGIALTGG